MGARGEAVRRLQERLKELGYLAGSADGIYGQATPNGVLYLQFDMGYSQTGTASAQFQKEVLYATRPPTPPTSPWCGAIQAFGCGTCNSACGICATLRSRWTAITAAALRRSGALPNPGGL